MKKKRLILAAMVLAFAAVAFLVGGADDGKPDAQAVAPHTPNAMVPSIIVDGVLYRISPKSDGYLKTASDPADYLGTVTSQVPLSQMPAKDGESNTHEVGAPFVACEGGIAVQQSDGAWRIFVPEKIEE